MSVIESFIETAKRRRGSVVFPEGDDERILQAARRLRDERIADPVLLGRAEAIGAVSDRIGLAIDDLRIVDPDSSDRIEAYAEAWVAARPKATPGVARRQVRKPLYFGGMMVHCGDVDTMVAGVANPTARIIKAGMLTVGPAPGIRTPSSFFLMVVPGLADRPSRSMVFADCAVNIEPDAEQLADIALASAASASNVLDGSPRVALLSGHSLVEEDHAAGERVRQATALLRERSPGLAVEGGLGLDRALDASFDANVLIFPDLNTGNIAYKMAQHLAGASAIGPFLQGFARPISDLSRGASVADVVTTTAVLQATP